MNQFVLGLFHIEWFIMDGYGFGFYLGDFKDCVGLRFEIIKLYIHLGISTDKGKNEKLKSLKRLSEAMKNDTE